jgi:hypothetical protein
MNEEMPGDLLEKARGKLMGDYPQLMGYFGYMGPADMGRDMSVPLQLDHEMLAKMIARALMEERERCARIAEALDRRDDDDFLEPEYACGRNVTAKTIAAAIRDQHTSSMESVSPGYEERRKALKGGGQ